MVGAVLCALSTGAEERRDSTDIGRQDSCVELDPARREWYGWYNSVQQDYMRMPICVGRAPAARTVEAWVSGVPTAVSGQVRHCYQATGATPRNAQWACCVTSRQAPFDAHRERGNTALHVGRRSKPVMPGSAPGPPTTPPVGDRVHRCACQGGRATSDVNCGRVTLICIHGHQATYGRRSGSQATQRQPHPCHWPEAPPLATRQLIIRCGQYQVH